MLDTSLSFRAQESLKVLGLMIGPQKIWAVNVRRSSFTLRSEINWSQYKFASERKILVQCILIHLWNAESIDGLYTISENDRKACTTLARIMFTAEELFPNRSFCELDRTELIELCFASLFRKFDSNCRFRSLPIKVDEALSYQVLVRTVVMINTWYALYADGTLNDGPEFRLSTTDVEILLKVEFQNRGRQLSEWKNGRSYGSIPFVVAHLLLTDALSVIHSKKNKYLLAYFATIRENNCHDLVSTFWNSTYQTRIYAYRNSGDASHLEEVNYDSIISARTKSDFIEPLHKKLTDVNGDDERFTFPWCSYTELVNQYNELQTAIYIVFLSVMGKRGPSEVQCFKAADIIPSNSDLGQDALMKPRNFKSNKGLQETQGVTNFIDDVFETLLSMSYIDKSENNEFLFVGLPSLTDVSRIPVRLSTSQMNVSLNAYYDSFCLRMSEKVDFSIKDLHPRLKSHQFRHSFAEFGLRRYDGAIEELIRQHFCHRYNHWWTKRYTGDKLDDERVQYLSKEYIKDLVPRILRDAEVDPDYVGGIAVYIKRELAPKIRTMNASEAENYLSQICDGVLQITPHEYGWCLLHEHFRSVAKCADTKGNPNPLATNSSKCINCANFCASRKSHLATQKQIAIAHIDFIESNVWKMPSLKNASIAAVRNAQTLFPELKELGTFE